MINFSYAVVIPTIGRPGLAELVATVDGDPAPACIVIADDRRSAATELDLPKTSAPLLVVAYPRTRAGRRAQRRLAAQRTPSGSPSLTTTSAIPLDWCRRLVRGPVGTA